MKIVVDNKIPFIKGVLEPYAEVVYLPGREIAPEDVRDADALIVRTRTVCDETLLKGSKVKVIASATIGYDHIDTAWCEAGGIVWRNAPGCNAESVKQYIVAALLALAGKYSLSLEGMTLGVVGAGNVGSRVAEAADILGMRVLLNDPPRKRAEGLPSVPLDTICRESDIITLHVPLTEEGPDATRHLFDAARIASLRKDQILINSSRGPVADNATLKAALKAGSLKAAVLDVWEGEPDIDGELLALLDIATPHIAGYSADGKANATTAAVRTVAEVLRLPLKDWAVSGIPAPVQDLEFVLDASGKSSQEVLTEAVRHTYDIAADSAALRAEHAAFERLRGDYPVRREFAAFTVSLRNGSSEMAEKLSRLGFNLG